MLSTTAYSSDHWSSQVRKAGHAGDSALTERLAPYIDTGDQIPSRNIQFSRQSILRNAKKRVLFPLIFTACMILLCPQTSGGDRQLVLHSGLDGDVNNLQFCRRKVLRSEFMQDLSARESVCGLMLPVEIVFA